MNHKYDSSTVFDHEKEQFKTEIQSIVSDLYSSIDKNSSFIFKYHSTDSEDQVKKPKNSYLATLVSIF